MSSYPCVSASIAKARVTLRTALHFNMMSLSGAVVVAQLVEWLLPTPEIRSLNPNIGKVLSTDCN